MAVWSAVAVDGGGGKLMTATTMVIRASALLRSIRSRYRGDGSRARRFDCRHFLALLVAALLVLPLNLAAALPAGAVGPHGSKLSQYVGPIQGHFSEHYFFSDALGRE